MCAVNPKRSRSGPVSAPDRVVAGSPPEWNLSIIGTRDDGRPFVAAVFPAGGPAGQQALAGELVQDGLRAVGLQRCMDRFAALTNR